MSVATFKRRIAVLVITPIVGLTLAGAAGTVAGVYDRPSHNSLDLTMPERGDRLTGPLGSAHIAKTDGWRTNDDGFRGTKDDGFRGN